MRHSFYGEVNRKKIFNDLERYVEEINILGFTVVDAVVPDDELVEWREKIDSIYKIQEQKFSIEKLSLMKEQDVCRAPLLYNFDFVKLATKPLILSIVQKILGDFFILGLQNAIINRPNTIHHQSSWHRDLPHQNFVSSKPLAVNALFVIDDFSELSGGTSVVPYTHKIEFLPSDSFIEKNLLTVNARAGSVVVFDSMLFHRAGENKSEKIRRAVNHLYSIPIIKQQYDFPRALTDKQNLTPFLYQLLGYTSQVPLDDKDLRETRFKKFINLKK